MKVERSSLVTAKHPVSMDNRLNHDKGALKVIARTHIVI